MKKNKLLAIVLVVVLTFAMLTTSALAADDVTVYVTIVNDTPVLTYEMLSVSDLDGDGAVTINDALIMAHAAYYDGEGEGYASAETEYGLSMTKLWGDESGAFGYYVNNQSAFNLSDPLQEGDSVCAFVYSDRETFSDTYCYFDQSYIDSLDGSISLTLTAATFDENWNPVTMPVANASILVDGEDIGVKTDENGAVTVSVSGGSHVLSASSEEMTLVPPVCVTNVALSESESKAAGNNNMVLYFVLAFSALAISIVALIAVLKKKAPKKEDSKTKK